MRKEDIEHLAKLARISVSDTEAGALAENITSILGYVSEIEAIAGTQQTEKKVGALHNVMRKDEDPHEGGLYTEDLLALAPHRHGQYIEVKKILDKTTE
jgi:aspartyl-tRNA(Asn)/glutamyl-tRNA(Gln) amidotransferase subunit C